MESIRLCLQVIVACGLLNVWLLRAGKATSYRGGDAKSLKEEFAAYGLSVGTMRVVGTLKVTVAIALLLGIWFPGLVLPAASLLIVLMIGALFMHFQLKDSLGKSVPALLMLSMAIGLDVL